MLVGMCGHVHAMVHTWNSEDNFQGSVLKYR